MFGVSKCLSPNEFDITVFSFYYADDPWIGVGGKVVL